MSGASRFKPNGNNRTRSPLSPLLLNQQQQAAAFTTIVNFGPENHTHYMQMKNFAHMTGGSSYCKFDDKARIVLVGPYRPSFRNPATPTTASETIVAADSTQRYSVMSGVYIHAMLSGYPPYKKDKDHSTTSVACLLCDQVMYSDKKKTKKLEVEDRWDISLDHKHKSSCPMNCHCGSRKYEICLDVPGRQEQFLETSVGKGKKNPPPFWKENALSLIMNCLLLFQSFASLLTFPAGLDEDQKLLAMMWDVFGISPLPSALAVDSHLRALIREAKKKLWGRDSIFSPNLREAIDIPPVCFRVDPNVPLDLSSWGSTAAEYFDRNHKLVKFQPSRTVGNRLRHIFRALAMATSNTKRLAKEGGGPNEQRGTSNGAMATSNTKRLAKEGGGPNEQRGTSNGIVVQHPQRPSSVLHHPHPNTLPSHKKAKTSHENGMATGGGQSDTDTDVNRRCRDLLQELNILIPQTQVCGVAAPLVTSMLLLVPEEPTAAVPKKLVQQQLSPLQFSAKAAAAKKHTNEIEEEDGEEDLSHFDGGFKLDFEVCLDKRTAPSLAGSLSDDSSSEDDRKPPARIPPKQSKQNPYASGSLKTPMDESQQVSLLSKPIPRKPALATTTPRELIELIDLTSSSVSVSSVSVRSLSRNAKPPPSDILKRTLLEFRLPRDPTAEWGPMPKAEIKRLLRQLKRETSFQKLAPGDDAILGQAEMVRHLGDSKRYLLAPFCQLIGNKIDLEDAKKLLTPNTYTSNRVMQNYIDQLRDDFGFEAVLLDVAVKSATHGGSQVPDYASMSFGERVSGVDKYTDPSWHHLGKPWNYPNPNQDECLHPLYPGSGCKLYAFVCNVPNTHYFLVIAYLEQKLIIVIDSLHEAFRLEHNEFVAAIFNYLKLQAQRQGSETWKLFDAAKWRLVTAKLPAIPTQVNNDCGLFALSNLESVLMGHAPSCTHEDITQVRQRVFLSIVNEDRYSTLRPVCSTTRAVRATRPPKRPSIEGYGA